MTRTETYERRRTWIGYWLFFLSLRFGKSKHGKNEIKVLHTHWFSHSPHTLPLHNCYKRGKKGCAEFLKLLEWSKLRLCSSGLWQRSFTTDFLCSRSGLAVQDCPKHRQTQNYEVRKLRRQRRRSTERQIAVHLTTNLVFPVTVT
jgi:hypothetical protein